MTEPRTIEALRLAREQRRREAHRDALVAASKHRAVALSDEEGTLTVLNVPPLPEVFTVVSWNVQTFEASKSLGSPFVNRVINRVLEALDADVCVLLETRAESYVNMNSIESGLRGDKGWKEVANEEDEEDDDEPDDDDDQPPPSELDMDEEDSDDVDLSDGGEPLTYTQVVSEMTGKLWVPPREMFVYHTEWLAHFRRIRDIKRYGDVVRRISQASKPTKKDATARDRLAKKLEKLQRERPQDYQRALNAPDKVRSLASRVNFAPKLAKALCVDQGGKSVMTWLETLRREEFAPVRDYYELVWIDAQWKSQAVRWDADFSKVDPSECWRVSLRLRVCTCGHHLGSGGCDACDPLGPRTTRLENLRGCINRVTFYMCTCQESYSVLLRQNTEVFGSSASGQWMQGKLVSAKAVAARLLMRAPDEHDTSRGAPQVLAGRMLGYQDKGVAFYGRCPFLLPLELWLPYTDASHKLYLVAFHGPFGASTKEGVGVRAAAMREVLDAGVGQGSRLGDEPDVLIIGDFNLDWTPSGKIDGKQKIANELYDDMKRESLLPMIDGGVDTSLISIFGRAQWRKTGTPSTSEFTSSAYDNCFLRGEALRPFASAAAVDVISWIEGRLHEFVLPAGESWPKDFDRLPTRTRAFYIYRKYVSDHLPIVFEVLVAPMTPRARALAEKARQERLTREDRGRRALLARLHHSGLDGPYAAVFAFDAVLSCELSHEPSDRYAPQDMVTHREATFVGVIDQHLDDHLVLKCSMLGGHVAWLAWRPDLRPRALAMFLRCFPPGARVEWRVKNPRPVG